MTERMTVQVSKAIKAQVAEGIRSAMRRKKMTQSDLARAMKTSRAVVHRLLKANDTSLTLSTLANVAAALGVKVSVKLTPAE